MKNLFKAALVVSLLAASSFAFANSIECQILDHRNYVVADLNYRAGTLENVRNGALVSELRLQLEAVLKSDVSNGYITITRDEGAISIYIGNRSMENGSSASSIVQSLIKRTGFTLDCRFPGTNNYY